MATPSPKRRRLEDDDRTPSGRPSFMSPTKASIARFNPNLLSASKNPVLAFSDEDGDGEATSSNKNPIEGIEEIDTIAGTSRDDDLPLLEAPTSTLGLFVTPAERSVEGGRNIRDQGDLSSPSRISQGRTLLNDAATARTASAASSPRSSSRTRAQAQPAGDIHHIRSADTDSFEAQSRRTAKRKERDELLSELRHVKRDLKQFESHLSASQIGTTGSKDAEMLVSLLSSNDSGNRPSEMKRQPLSISSIFSSFLPFSRALLPSNPTTAPNTNKPDISHRPVDLDDPLPYLSLFTSLSFSEEIEPLPQSLTQSENDSYKELHHITIRSPLNLLTAVVHLTTIPVLGESLTAPLPEVCNIMFGSISPWATAELLPVVRQHARDREVGALFNAFNTYWELCLSRAECWVRCEATFKHLAGSSQEEDKENNAQMGKEKKAPRRSRRGRGQVDEDEQPAAAEPATSPVIWTQGKLSRKDLLRNLGRSNLTLASHDFALHISWAIQFDWLGEAQSVVDLEAQFPAAWHESDERASLKNVPAVFQDLVRKRGVFEAVEVLVKLLG